MGSFLLAGKLFESAIKLTNVSNVNTTTDKLGLETILYFAASFGRTDTIDYLLKNYLKKLIGSPEQFVSAIITAATNGKDKALQPLVKKNVLERLIKYPSQDSKQVCNKIVDYLTSLNKNKFAKKVVKNIATKALETINEIKYLAVLEQLRQLKIQNNLSTPLFS
jgi:hypothetical protein